ncbi:MAG TPA: HAD-IIA family hydrolase [Acidimicrobiales bacterium]|nr:HAD-IIA family hydrolase [Acidimicrobiales bacterium]
MTWALDLDGVVWLAGREIPGSAKAVAALRAAGERVVFLTNNSGPLVAEHLGALARIGIDCPHDDLTTSAQAAASMVPPGSRAAVIGAGGIVEALQARGVKIVEPSEAPDAIVVGRTVDLDYWALAAAATAVREGVRFVAANTDATFPVGLTEGHPGDEGHRASQDAEHSARASGGDGLLPGAGALVAFIATASGRGPEVAGKPHPPMAALVKSRYGSLSVVAGDRPDTDGLFARATSAKFALVLSGVTRQSDLPVEPAPDLVGADLLSVVNQFLSSRRPSRTRPG